MIKINWNILPKFKEIIFKGGLVLFIGMSIVNVGNYLFNLIMGRMLGPVDYGSLVALISLLTIIGVPAAAIQTSTMKFSSTLQAQGKEGQTHFLFRYLTKRIFLASLIIFIILLIFSSYLSSFLNLGSNLSLIILVLASLFLFLLPINRGIIQGRQNFWGLSVDFVIEPIIKIIAGTLLVILGFKLNGAVIAYPISLAVAYALSFFLLTDILDKRPKPVKTSTFWIYSIPVLIGIFLFSILTYADVIMAKHFLNPKEAGLYSSLSTIAKIVFYFSMPFVAVMFPKVSKLWALGKKHFSILAQTFVIVFVLSVAVMGFFMLFPSFTIKILFGSQYLSVAPYLGQLSFAMFLLALINLFVNYYLAIGNTKFLYFLFIFTLLEIILLILFHANYQQIINNLTISFGGLLISLSTLYICSKKDKIIYALNNYSHIKQGKK